jgi:exosortase
MSMDTMEFSAAPLGARLKANRGSLLLAALGFAPLLSIFFALSWNRPAYQFFPSALVAAALLATRAAKEAGGTLVAGNPLVSRGLALATGLAFLLANVLWSPWLGFIVFLLALAAVLWGLGGRNLCQAFVPVGLMLLAILPPPLGWDERLTLWLRSLAVQVSCGLLDWLRITFVQDGNTIQLPGQTLFVEEACSGINSFVLCNAFCLFWFLWQRRPVWRLAVALLATSLFVVLGNILRITVCSWVFARWHLDLLHGWRHETFGLLLLLGYCGLVLSVDQLLVFLVQPARLPVVPNPRTPAAPATVVAPPAPPVGGRAALPSGPVFGFKLAAPGLALVGLGFLAAHLVMGGHEQALARIFVSPPELKFSLPATLAGWQRVDATSGELLVAQILGVHSTSWHFQRNGLQAVVAADYPLDGFHNVRVCYVGNGWQVLGEEDLPSSPGGADPRTVKLTLQQSIRHALVLHSVMDEHGVWLSRTPGVVRRFAVPPTGYRVQLITGGYAPVPPATVAAVQELFFQARQLLAQQLVDQLRKPAAK